MVSCYAGWVRSLKSLYGQAAVRRLNARRLGERADWHAEDWLDLVAPGQSVIDVGGMWGIHGAHSRYALTAGARSATLVDIYTTPEFMHAQESEPKVRFVHGEADDPRIVAETGTADVVWCWGVLYHHPNPHRLVCALQQMCGDGGTLLLESLTAPEVPGVPQAAVYLPHLRADLREAFHTTRQGGALRQLGLGEEFDRSRGYSNNFFAMSPSAVRALLRSVGFDVVGTYPSPSGALRHVFHASAKSKTGG